MIAFPNRMKQLLDFNSLKIATETSYIMPTDVDGVLDYHNIGFLYYEYKFRDKGMSEGQRLYLEHQVKTNWKAGKVSYAIVVEHYEEDTDIPVKTGLGKVRLVFTRDGWVPPKFECSAREFTVAFIKECKKRETAYKG